MSQHTPIPDEAVAALEAGSQVEAIKIFRESTGLGLKEAKDAVDAYLSGKTLVAEGASSTSVPLKAVTLLNSGDLIAAIRLTREHTGLGLKDSKLLLEQYLTNHPATREQFNRISTRKRNRVILVLIATLGLTAIIYFVVTQLMEISV